MIGENIPPDSSATDNVTTDSSRLLQKKRRYGLWAVSIIIVVIAIIATALLVVLVVLPPRPPATVQDAGQKITSSEELVAKLSPQLRGKNLDVTIQDGLGGLSANNYSAYTFPAYQVAGKHFKNLPTEGYGNGYVSDDVIATANYKAMTDFFVAYKFKVMAADGDASSPTTSVTYESDELLCRISRIDANTTTVHGWVTSIGCADKASYEQAAAALAPFYTAYKKTSLPALGLVLGNLQVGDGAKDYQHVTLYQTTEASSEKVW